MTRENLIKMCTMRIDGCTYQEIADEMECTRQNVQQTLSALLGTNESRYYQNSIYPNLTKEIRIQHHKLTDFAKASGIDYRRLQGLLVGRGKISIDEVIIITKVLNKDVAYLFEKKTTTDLT